VDPRAGVDDVEERKFLTLPGSNSDPSVVQSAVPAPDLVSLLLFISFSKIMEESKT
jgi:hypothetical protein